jgi:hypothetical protein
MVCQVELGAPRPVVWCAGCGAVAYCSTACAGLDADRDHDRWLCAFFRRSMAEAGAFVAGAAGVAVAVAAESEADFVGRLGLSGPLWRLWRPPAAAAIATAFADCAAPDLDAPGSAEPNLQVTPAAAAAGWGLSPANLPPPEPPPTRCGPPANWVEYLRWRGLDVASPAPLLLTFPLTLYYVLAALTDLLPAAGAGTGGPGRPLVVHLPGAEKEQDFLPAFAELGALLAWHLGPGPEQKPELEQEPEQEPETDEPLVVLHLVG